ncbi:MAG: DinB family protein [Candidatus Rokubacteria bacterium]|nr:DinB family protein [Candidatus Rokubacteria bacterium]
MVLPRAIDAIWSDMEAVRAEALREVDGLSQAQVDWRPAGTEWSIGEILSHLSVAETQTGKLTTKLTREAEAAGALAPYPADVAAFAPIPAPPMHGMQAPPAVQPERGVPVTRLLADLRAVRARSRQSMEKIAGVDPRPLTFKHFALGELNLAQWWTLQARHDGAHLEQIRAVKVAPGFPRA